MPKKRSKHPLAIHLLIGFLLILIITPYLSLLATIRHENAHLQYYKEYDVCGKYEPDFIRAIRNFFSRQNVQVVGMVYFCDSSAREKYYSLDNTQREQINLAGILADQNTTLAVLIFLLLTTIASTFIFIYYKNEPIKNLILLYALFTIIILVIFLLDLCTRTKLNLTKGDLQVLLNLWDCGKNCTSLIH
jgi:magnesium-transporting ATPase (P-type)